MHSHSHSHTHGRVLRQVLILALAYTHTRKSIHLAQSDCFGSEIQEFGTKEDLYDSLGTNVGHSRKDTASPARMQPKVFFVRFTAVERANDQSKPHTGNLTQCNMRLHVTPLTLHVYTVIHVTNIFTNALFQPIPSLICQVKTDTQHIHQSYYSKQNNTSRHYLCSVQSPSSFHHFIDKHTHIDFRRIPVSDKVLRKPFRHIVASFV